MSKLCNVRRRTLDVRRISEPVLFLLLLLTSYFSPLREVFADEYHYNNILIGDRAAGMGGAYTAISDDPSGLYYNPAGIVYAAGSNLSASANAFHMTQTKYNKAITWNDKGVIGGNDWVRSSSALLPNFFGIVQPLGKGKVGFSYAVTDSTLENQDQVFTNIPGINRYVINFNRKDNTYNFGPSYAIKVNDRFSVGATLYAHYRENEWILNRYKDLPTGADWLNVYYQTNESGIKPIVGFMWTPIDKLSLGLKMSQTKVFSSDVNVQKMYKTDTSNTVTRYDLTINEKQEHPFSTTLGVAYFQTSAFLVSGDLSYYAKTSDPNFGDKEATWNAALGTEYYASERWALRAGLFTNRANTPVINNGDNNKLDHVDLYGGSLSMTYFTRQSSVTLGGSYSYGAGKAQVSDNTTDIQDVESQSETIFLSAGYSY